MRGVTLVGKVLSESDLFEAYKEDPAVVALKIAGRKEVKPCACRGMVVADPLDPALGVREHQETRQHTRWREDLEL